MKTLVFTESEVFRIIYDGFIGSQRNLSGSSIDEITTAVAIIQKFQQISDELQLAEVPGIQMRTSRALKSEGGTVELEDAEFRLLVECFKANQWRIFGAEQVLKAHRMLEEAGK